LGFDCGSSNGQKQSINDASQYVAVLTHLPEGVGMDVAKIQNFWELIALWGVKNEKKWRKYGRHAKIISISENL